ncbi:MAG: ATP-binding protein [Megasphaera elsdenii]|nr:putative DNA binding domain-containing protein [Megasphaera elsdenii]MDY5381959.1 ATP-binding protein [Megasphaera elsdenii]
MYRFPTEESLTVEFKSDRNCLPDNDIIDAVVAFANTEGGDLYLGIEDDGTITGLHPKHRDITRLTAFIANKTVPPVSTRATILHDGQCDVLKLSVPRYTSIVASAAGKIQKRRLKADHTPENVPLYPYEIPQRLSSLSLLDFSAQPLPDSTRDDLSIAERERLRHIIRTYHGESALLELDDLELDKALRLVTQIGEGYIPTVTGMLLIGRAERLKELIPTAESSIQIMDNAQLRVNETFTLPLLASIEKINTYFLSINQEDEIDVGLFRVPIPHYAPQAFREALINAYSHRDYSMLGRVRVLIERDGMTIANPGGFIQGITYDSLLDAEPHGRNPVLADCLKRIGMAERSGRGIDRIYAGSLRYGKLPPDYSQSTDTSVRLYIPDSRPDKNFVRLLIEEQEKLNRDFTVYELLILNLLKTHHRMSQKEIADAAGIPSYKLPTTLESLVESGLIEAIGRGKSRGYFLSAHLYQRQENTIGYVRQTDIDTVRYPELILKLAQKQGLVTRSDVVKLLHVSPAQAYHLLNKLKKNHKLILEGRGKYAHYKPVSRQ